MIYYLKHNIHKLNWTIIGNVLGMVLIAQACLMVLPVMVDLIYQEGLFDSYLIVIGICLVLGYGLTRKRRERILILPKMECLRWVLPGLLFLSLADYHSTCRVKFLLLWIASLKRCLDLQRQVQVF